MGTDKLYDLPPGTTAPDPEGFEESTVVNLDDDDDQPAPAEEPEEIPVQLRKDKRRARGNGYREQVEAREKAEREAEELRLRVAKAEAKSELMDAIFQRRPQHPQGPDPKQVEQDYKDKRNKLVREQVRLQEAFAALPEEARAEQQEEYQDRFNDLGDQLEELRASRRAPVGQVNEQQVAARASQAAVEAQFPEVFANQRTRAMVKIRFDEATQLEGQPNNRETAMKCIREVSERLKRGDGRDVTDQERKRFAGVPRGGSAGTGGGNDAPREIKMTPMMRKMAMAAYPYLPAEQAYKRWGREMVSKEK